MAHKKTPKPFGGYVVSFENRHEPLDKVFGIEPLTPAKMTKKLWRFIKKNELAYFED